MDQLKNVIGIVVYILQVVEQIPQLLYHYDRVEEFTPQLLEEIKQIL